MKSPSVPAWCKGRFASSTARHRHRISVKSKGADLVARKLATKFGEEAEAEATVVAVMLVPMPVPVPKGAGSEAQRESILCESRSARAHQPLSPSFSLLFSLTLSLYATALAILSSRICDHQHAKWIKFLDYTFRRPFFTRFRFLYPASRSAHSPSHIARAPATVFQIVSPHLRISVPRAVSSTRALFRSPLYSSRFFFRASAPLCPSSPSDCPLAPQPWAIFSNLAKVLQRTDAPLQLFGIYIDLPRDSRTRDPPIRK